MKERLEDYDFEIPQRLIAQSPLPRRDQSRLLLLRRGEPSRSHHRFEDLPRLLPSGSVLVVNNTRVLPHRLAARLPSGVRVEALLVKVGKDGVCIALVKKARRLKPGMEIPFAEGRLTATALERDAQGAWKLAFQDPESLPERLQRDGLAPLPPYIRRDIHRNHDGEADRRAYQTLFAKEGGLRDGVSKDSGQRDGGLKDGGSLYEGAIAAPTAGLHFTPEVLAALQARNIEIVELTLHVGVGTFTPVTESDPALHTMHREWFRISRETARAVQSARSSGRAVIAVGTTSVRSLETWAAHGFPDTLEAWSDLFIRPSFEFRVIDGMITNFHQPRSTLLMLVAAFHGRERLREAYREAVREDYRFFSFGDCMAILPGGSQILG